MDKFIHWLENLLLDLYIPEIHGIILVLNGLVDGDVACIATVNTFPLVTH